MRADDQDKSAPAPAKVRKLAEKMFLGPEMLTWLYFTLLDEGMELELAAAFVDGTPPEDTLVRFAIGKRAQLKTIDASGAKVALTGPGLDDNGEILQAIRRGALIDVLALEVSIQSRVYAFTLRGDDGGLTGVKLPDLFSEPEDAEAATVEDPLAPKKAKRRPKLPLEDVLALRMQCLAELERVLDALFAKFLVRRLARAWHSEDVASMRKHVATGLKSRLVDL
jgi:hypothetical protein